MATVLVASTGGHLHQLWKLVDRLPIEGRPVWVTFDSEQSRSVLADEDVRFVPYVEPRGYRSLARCVPRAVTLLRGEEVSSVISTGSGVALAFLPVAVALGIPAHYIESATRLDGPSFTGRWLQRVPRVHLHNQWERWADDRWHYAGSVFDGYRSVAAGDRETEVARIVVSCGTVRPYGFRRLLERLIEIIPPGAEVLWQTGATDTAGLAIEARPDMAEAELRAAIGDADVVIAHAGTGISLTALEEGKLPLLVPREHAHDEHIDDHQFQTAEALSGLGLAHVRRVDDLAIDDLLHVAGRRVSRSDDIPPMRL
ncbi:MAG: glycosyltransferase family 28 [Acidimicrobiia bacterium]|nr:glycosyltransferase family 28 [Acidimicrobiia bacterium]